MLNDIIEKGKTFANDFDRVEIFGKFMRTDKKGEYLTWLSNVGTYIEIKFKDKAPEMTKKILKYIVGKSILVDNYNVIMGYLQTLKEITDEEE